MTSQKNDQRMISSIITKTCLWNTCCISPSAPMYPRKKRESKLFMMIAIEMLVVDSDSSEKRCDNNNESETRQCKIIEKLIPSMRKRWLYIVYPNNICRNLHKSRDIEYPPMNIVEDDEKNEIHEWKCKHKFSIGKPLRNSRKKEKKAKSSHKSYKRKSK